MKEILENILKFKMLKVYVAIIDYLENIQCRRKKKLPQNAHTHTHTQRPSHIFVCILFILHNKHYISVYTHTILFGMLSFSIIT